MFEFNVRPVSFEDNNLLAYADVKVNGIVTIRNVKLLNGANGPFASMPSFKGRDGNYHSVCFIDKEHWQQFNDELAEAYNQKIIELVKKQEQVNSSPKENGGAPEPELEQEPESVMEQAI